ncbi:tetratricopeptide repeat protein [Agarilytica rhodophyticola]|uniref:tetratricopeptide repeat protein n=1 Tax=Agarilytica rhodophyticola TaxID=1737490 RepID=UPI000B343EBB|nr:tetratricopeptide repeat protein [Agarilytica rhodophyticola]
MNFFVKISLISPLFVLLSCSSNDTQTLGQLKYEEEKEKELKFEQLSHEQVRQEYKELIDLFEDEQLKEQIERRIADVYQLEADTDLDNQTESSQYVEAIKAYRNILERYPNSPDNAEVFYQLAKAYDLEGQQEEAMKMLTELVSRHPNYANIAEAHFRKADIHFNWQQYPQAKASYNAVTQLAQGRLRLNAHYMLGWVHYKQLDFESSVDSFAFVLNSILLEGRTLDSLDKAEKPLVDDSIHSMSLALDKIGGAEVIEEIPSIAQQTYIWMLYDHLGDYYLGKELYEQSADTFRYYVRKFPDSDKAPLLHNKLISAYTKGSFPRQALEEKEKYVKAYGINSSYPGNENGIGKDIATSLIVYLEELARFNYTEGQTSLAFIEEENKRNPDNPDEEKIRLANGDAVFSFKKSATFYGEYIDTFPQDKRVDEMRFLEAEAHFLAGDFLLAAQDYEAVAYEPVGTSAADNAADSGYAAIISYQKHIDSLGGDSSVVTKSEEGQTEVTDLRATAVDSMLRFSKKFDSDERSPTVLTNAAEYLFGLNQYQRAIDVVQDLLTAKTLDKTLKKTAYGIMAHSFFKLEKYPDAEASYVAQRKLVAKDSEEFTQISERIATTVFKNAEVLEESQGKREAAQELLKIKRLSPTSPIRITAQYDAASLFIAVEAWPEAIVELKELIELYPEHKLAIEFPRKLALAYQKDEQWANAAGAYLDLYNNDTDEDIKREALFLSANMYEKNGELEQAIKYFKRYARNYEEPFDTRMEARYHLAVNYLSLKETDKHLYWLRRIIAGDAKGGTQRTERSRWLGAWANAQYGDYHADRFRGYYLGQPLQKSLPEKQEFFQKASDHYQKAADYGILEFVTMSSYKIGNLYEAFAVDLRKAPAPKGLSADDMKVYSGIIEEQASPFDQLAVDVHQANVDRAWEGHFDDWIDKSFGALRKLQPQRYNKQEVATAYGEEIR